MLHRTKLYPVQHDNKIMDHSASLLTNIAVDFTGLVKDFITFHIKKFPNYCCCFLLVDERPSNMLVYLRD